MITGTDILALSKKVYRQKLREVHPDLNPQDAKAHEKTRALLRLQNLENWAYHISIGMGVKYKNQWYTVEANTASGPEGSVFTIARKRRDGTTHSRMRVTRGNIQDVRCGPGRQYVMILARDYKRFKQRRTLTLGGGKSC